MGTLYTVRWYESKKIYANVFTTKAEAERNKKEIENNPSFYGHKSKKGSKPLVKIVKVHRLSRIYLGR